VKPLWQATVCHVCQRQVRAIGVDGDGVFKVESHGDFTQPESKSPSGRAVRPTCEGSGREIAVPIK
jgi:hypothetical protein